ncbi:hypothetical protein B0H12DRAFT_1231503 [Mycena haematopus]|nr:hypothetical protein B0H12DRAFT_1231503 [Mycena haematopus]
MVSPPPFPSAPSRALFFRPLSGQSPLSKIRLHSSFLDSASRISGLAAATSAASAGRRAGFMVLYHPPPSAPSCGLFFRSFPAGNSPLKSDFIFLSQLRISDFRVPCGRLCRFGRSPACTIGCSFPSPFRPNFGGILTAILGLKLFIQIRLHTPCLQFAFPISGSRAAAGAVSVGRLLALWCPLCLNPSVLFFAEFLRPFPASHSVLKSDFILLLCSSHVRFPGFVRPPLPFRPVAYPRHRVLLASTFPPFFARDFSDHFPVWKPFFKIRRHSPPINFAFPVPGFSVVVSAAASGR